MSAYRSHVAGLALLEDVLWMALLGTVVGLGLGFLQPLFAVGVGAGIYAGPTYLGLFFLLCLAALVLVGLVALFVRAARDLTLPLVALSGCLALGMLGGNTLAASLHVSFASPAPPRTIHPTGAGWSVTGNLTEGRSHHTATLLLDGRVLVAGGIDADEHQMSSAELYNPQTGTWTTTGSMLRPRSYHTATLLADGRVLVTSSTGHVELYDPAAGTWSTTADMPTPRTSYAATLLRDGRVLVSGGRNEAIDDQLAPAELFDPTTGTWGSAGTMQGLRASHTATLLTDGRVLIAGGQATETSPDNVMGFLDSAELYDPATGTWTATESMQLKRSGHAAVLLADGRVLVIGGLIAEVSEIFNPAKGTWSPGGKVEGWMSPTASLLGDGRVLVSDGLSRIVVHDPRTGISGARANGGHGFGSTATLLSDGRVIVAGGMLIDYGHRSDRLADAHLYDPD